MVQPVRGYEFGVPKEAIGVEVEGEIKIYDEDEWEDHIGKGTDPDDIFDEDHDPDVVGAKTKTITREIETDEELIDYTYVHQIKGDSADGNLDSRQAIAELSDPSNAGGSWPIPELALDPTYSPLPPLIYILNVSVWGSGALVMDPIAIYTLIGPWMNTLTYQFYGNIITAEQGKALYSPDIDGTYLTRDLWTYTDEAYDADPDEEDDEVPYLADPRDLKDSYDNFISGWIDHQLKDTKALTDATVPFISDNYLTGGLVQYAPGQWAPSMSQGDVDNWEALNLSIQGVLAKFPSPVKEALLAGLGVPNDLSFYQTLGGSTGLNGGDYLKDYGAGVYGGIIKTTDSIYYKTEYGHPMAKAALLIKALQAGQPGYIPEHDYWNKVVEEYNLPSDETLVRLPYLEYGKDIVVDPLTSLTDGEVSSIPIGQLDALGNDLEGETIYVYAYVDVSVENGVVTVEIEYKDDTLDPKDAIVFGGDGEDTLDDWEWVFPYGEYGSQTEQNMKDGDTIFYQRASLDVIPGFEVTVILGASALSILALIYVVMKKRRM